MAEQDRVGGVAAVDRRGDGRGHRHAGQRAAEVAGGEHLGGAVLAELAGDGVGVAAGVDGLDRVGELAGLGEHLERDGGDLAVGGLGEHPDLRKSHVPVPPRGPSGSRGRRRSSRSRRRRPR